MLLVPVSLSIRLIDLINDGFYYWRFQSQDSSRTQRTESYCKSHQLTLTLPLLGTQSQGAISLKAC